MFKKLTIKEQLKIEEGKNAKLAQKLIDLETAIFEIAEITSKEVTNE